MGLASIYSRVLQDMRERDARDRGRAVAPLTLAKDALVIDSSELDADQVFARALAYIGAYPAGPRPGLIPSRTAVRGRSRNLLSRPPDTTGRPE